MILTYWLENDQVHFIMKMKTTGWIAIGLESPSGGGMINADIFIGSVKDGQTEILDTWSTTFAQPTLDTEGDSSAGTNDITFHASSENDGYTEIHFSRPLVTNDPMDHEILLNEENKLIYAYHESSDELSYHGFLTRGKSSFKINTLDDNNMSLNDEQDLNSHELTLNDGIYKLRWEIMSNDDDDDIGHVKFDVTVENEGWIALGISESGSMIGADIIVMRMDAEGNCEAEDYWSESFVEPVKDSALGGSNDITDVTCARSSTVTEFSFRRPLETSDPNDLK